MSIRFLPVVLLSLVLSFQVVGCCGADEPEAIPPGPPVNSNTCLVTSELPNQYPYYNVFADNNLSIEYKRAIESALGEWCGQTNGTLRYNLIYDDMTQQTPITSSSHKIQIYVKDPGPGLVGWTNWQSDNFGAYMLIAPGIDEDTFRKTMLHELGHAFNLSFNGNTHYLGPYQSVMYPSIGDSSEHLGCPELTSFCSNYGCKIECTNTAKAAKESSANEVRDDRGF